MYEHSEAVNKVMLDLNSQRGRYDFILQPHRELGRFVENGHLVPLETFMDDPNLRNPDFKPEDVLYNGLWKEISWYDGKVYGFPFTALTMYMWYRKDLAEDPSREGRLQGQVRLRPAAGAELGPVSRPRGVVHAAGGRALRHRAAGQAPRGALVRVAEFSLQLRRRHDGGAERQRMRADHRQQPGGGRLARIL